MNESQIKQADRSLNRDRFDPNKDLSPRTPKPTSTYFINGTPFVDCGRCGVPIKLFDAQNQKISILIKFKEEIINTYVNGRPALRSKWIPIIKSDHGCFDCWNLFETIKAGAKGTKKLPFLKRI